MFSGLFSPPAAGAGACEVGDVVLGDDFDAGVDELVDGLLAGDLRRGEGAEFADLGRELGDRAGEATGLDRGQRIRGGVEADDDERLAGGLGGVERAEGHLVVGGEDALEVGVGGQQVFGDGLALGAVGVGGLDGDDLEAGLLHGGLGAVLAQVVDRVAGCAADDGDLVAGLEGLGDELAAELAAELVVGADEGGLVGEVGDVGVDQDDRDAGRDGLLEGRLDLVGLRRRDGDGIDLGGDRRLDDADLAFDVGLFVRAEEGGLDRRIGLHGRIDARADRLPVGAGHGLDDHRDVQRLVLAAGSCRRLCRRRRRSG